MFKLLSSPRASEFGSAALVVFAAWVVGRYAAQGMNTSQWVCGVCAILGSISVAVMVRIWPAPAKVEIED